MKLGSLKTSARDGQLVVVSRDLSRALPVPDIASSLQFALDDWRVMAPQLEAVYLQLNQSKTLGTALRPTELAAPLPRAYQWLDGSAYLSHVKRTRKARGAEMPASFLTDPLMYQGISAPLSGPCDPIKVLDPSWGIDFEAEVVIATDDVPAHVTRKAAEKHIVLLMITNDVSLRNLIPNELKKGFGFLHGKPPNAFSPVAVTADELGTAWDGGRLHLPLITTFNGEKFGEPDAGEGMHFDFPALISHAAKTRPLCAGTLIGSGTVSNDDIGKGFSCLVEKRFVEIIDTGYPRTPFLQFGDRVRIEMLNESGESIFGAIEQHVQKQ